MFNITRHETIPSRWQRGGGCQDLGYSSSVSVRFRYTYVFGRFSDITAYAYQIPRKSSQFPIANMLRHINASFVM